MSSESLPLILTIEEPAHQQSGAFVAIVRVDQGLARVGSLVQISSPLGRTFRLRILKLEQYSKRIQEAGAGSLVTAWFENGPQNVLQPGVIATAA